ncbi:hypothetical protein AAVH_09242 [Aphelenchoides avenae]|nr:hypothetical protein AAVH_09242 [Aphelenchus avenae]
MLDIFLFLDRFHLDVSEYACRRLRQVIREKTTDVCIRPLKSARFTCSPYRTHYELFISSDVPSHKTYKTMASAVGSNFDELLDTFFSYVRNSVVDSMDFSNLPLNWAFCRRVQDAGPSIQILDILQLTDIRTRPEVLHEIFASGFARVNAIKMRQYMHDFHAAHLTDALLHSFIQLGVHTLDAWLKPSDVDHFEVTEDAILDFCFAERPNADNRQSRFLELSDADVTADFFNRLVQASKGCKLEFQLTLKLSNIVTQNTALYDDLQTPMRNGIRFDFFEDVRLQIVMGNFSLELLRGTEPDDGSEFFY